MEHGRNTERLANCLLLARSVFHPWLHARVWTTPWTTLTKWPRAKRAGTSSVFRTNTPSGPYRAIGPQWQNSREKHHFLAFWPSLWPNGSGGRCIVAIIACND